MKKLVLGLLVVLTMIMFMGCSTMISGTRQQIPISSNPSEADLTITEQVKLYNIHGQSIGVREDTVVVAKTPFVFDAKRSGKYKIFLKKIGYKQYSLATSKTLNPAIFGNIFFGGLIGIVVDAGSGASSIVLPERIDAILLPEEEDIQRSIAKDGKR